MNEIERRQKVYQELLEEARLKDPRKRPGEFSAGDFAKEVSCERKKAKDMLDRKVEEGVLGKRITTSGAYYYVV